MLPDVKEQMNYKDMTLREIANEIRKDWGGNTNHAAVPYLDAMMQMVSIEDTFFMDSGLMIVSYFLCNASTWKGQVARDIKKELNRRIKKNTHDDPCNYRSQLLRERGEINKEISQ